MSTGIALIKPEFLRPSIQANVVQINSNSATEKIGDDEASAADGVSAIDSTDSKKRKNEEKKDFRGQNKKRPRPQRPSNEERLCTALMDGRACPFGDQCRFTHDLETFWRSKPPDIADRCPNYEAFGKCFYSFSCRFAGAHVDTTAWKNLEDEEKLIASNAKDKNELNKLDKDVQNQLRRHRYDFSRSSGILSIGGTDNEKNEMPDVERGPDRSSNGATTVDVIFQKEKRAPPRVSWSGRRYLAPLTTVGNLPFRRICKEFGAEITCGEMAMAFELLQGRASEWALVKRHASENIFGVQLCGSNAEVMTKCAQVLTEQVDVDFIDINMGCPIDLVCERGAGCSLMNRQSKVEHVLRSMRRIIPDDIDLTVKMRTGYYENKNVAHVLASKLADMGIASYTVHGRSREARYTKSPDWGYIRQCATAAAPLPCYGCGDVLSYEEYYQHLDELVEATSGNGGVLIARGALIKPWIFTEIEERRHWDISSSERFDILKRYVNYGLEHWGSDQQGVNNTRRFLLEWLSFSHRYIPIGILERMPQRINERPPFFIGRDDLETLMASTNCADWIKISEMLLGPVEPRFSFLPKHKANAYQ